MLKLFFRWIFDIEQFGLVERLERIGRVQKHHGLNILEGCQVCQQVLNDVLELYNDILQSDEIIA